MLHGPTRLREACPVEAAALRSKRKFPIGLSWAPSLRLVMIGKHAEHGAVRPAAKQPVRACDAEDVHDLPKLSYQLFAVFSVTGLKFSRHFCEFR